MKTLPQVRWLLMGVLAVLLILTGNSHSQSSFVVGNYSGLTLTGLVGSARSIQYVDALSSSSQAWTTLSNFNLPSASYFFVDPTSGNSSNRFYRPQPAGVSLRMFPGLTITGAVGSTNVVQFDNGGVWTTLETLVLTASPLLWIDMSAPPFSKRTYRVVDIGLAPVITSPVSLRAHSGYLLRSEEHTSELQSLRH